MPPLGDFFDPFSYLAGAAGKVVADGWTAAMLGLWNAGLWAVRLVLRIMDAFLTPDLAAGGPGAALYRATFWIAAVLVVAMAMVQFGVAAVRRDGRSLARVGVGLAQFAIVWAAWIVYGVAVIAACGGLTRALMQALLNVTSWSAWQPWQPFSIQDIADGTVATVLGLLGLLLWLAAIGHLLVMLTRGGALLVLAATTPVSAAGLVSDAGRAWFWKSLRWFHAAAFTPVVMVVVLGVGVQMTTGVAAGLADGTQAAVGTALPGVILILIGCFSPLALFKLLAFVEPGTPSGAALRQGLAAQGGLQGLLAGSGTSPASPAAVSTDQYGRSQGESAGQDATSARFAQAQRGLLGTLGGAAGTAAAQGLGLAQTLGARAIGVGADLTNQMGVGHHSYYPDFTGVSADRRTGRASWPGGRGGGQDADDDTPMDDGGPDVLPTPAGGPPDPTPRADSRPSTGATGPTSGSTDAPPASPAPPSTAGSAPAGSTPAGSGGAAGGTAAAAARVPVVPA